ncbi:MAG TPA: haloacid dehalogenase type II [Actinophytocola sp.]|uniref:haloacid dehalogenase type II n=1 Tax=Actinophytocola sp. TaxID=1872138 RepID=UPI002DB8112E|nr:haloacid dehalogenase type II [Actinophytocola sp.]HEU5470862.1 haloacid dehalogenase type II [Actinophytocola sp.]
MIARAAAVLGAALGTLNHVRVLAFDIFGTTVDWWTGVAGQVGRAAAERGVELDGGAFATAWRARYVPSMELVRRGELPWQNLDALHRRSLDELLEEHGVAAAFDEPARAELVRSWHRLPAWPDAAPGLARLRTRYTVVATSNGGFALLTNLVKAAELPFDAVVSAELVRRYKPDPEVYQAVAGLLDAEPGDVLMVAAHTWDLAGARAAGLRTAFIERPREKGPNGRPDRAENADADLVTASFTELADRLGC